MSKPEIRINGTVMQGVTPGRGFYDTLRAPLEAKEYISNESRLEDGVRVLPTPVKYKRRSFVLEFQVTGATENARDTNLSQFLYNLTRPASGATVGLSVTGINHTFNVIYTGKSATYSGGLSGKSCKIKIGFDEPVPAQLD